jgi:hypothetical protein
MMTEKTWKDNNHTYKWSHNPDILGEKLKHKDEDIEDEKHTSIVTKKEKELKWEN